MAGRMPARPNHHSEVLLPRAREKVAGGRVRGLGERRLDAGAPEPRLQERSTTNQDQGISFIVGSPNRIQERRTSVDLVAALA